MRPVDAFPLDFPNPLCTCSPYEAMSINLLGSATRMRLDENCTHKGTQSGILVRLMKQRSTVVKRDSRMMNVL